jgi:hypothetical protein
MPATGGDVSSTGPTGPADRERDLASALWESAGRPEQVFGAYFLDGSDPRSEVARSLERQVFLETFGNTPELMAEEYGPFEPASLLIAVLDHRRLAVTGMVRLIFESTAGLKTLRDIEHIWQRPLGEVLPAAGLGGGDTSRPDIPMADVATMAVAPDYRGDKAAGLISLALYRALMMAVIESGMYAFIAVLDLVVLDLIQQRCRDPFTRFAGCEPLRYLDSPSSLPVYCVVDEWEPRLRMVDPAMHGILFEGVGVEPFLWTPPMPELARVLPAA